VVDSSASGFLPAEVIRVPPSAEAFDVHRALFSALAAAGTFPALRRGGLIDSGEATLQGWPPVRVLRLLAAKWKHVAAAARTKGAGQAGGRADRAAVGLRWRLEGFSSRAVDLSFAFD